MTGQIEGTAEALQVSDSSGDPVRWQRQIFGDSIYSAAEGVVQSGRVRDVRVLQGGNVVTGIVSAEPAGVNEASRFRVYIRNLKARMDGECSCGQRGGTCVHVAAVSIVAAGATAREGASGGHQPARPQLAYGNGSRQETVQQLCYLIEQEGRLSIWVVQKAGASIVPGSACVFVPRLPRALSSAAAELPRYVDTSDREILSTLAQQSPTGPWRLSGEAGGAVLMRCVSTGRAFHDSSRGTGSAGRPLKSSAPSSPGGGALPASGQPLIPGAPRAISFFWSMLPNGDQALTWEDADSLDVLSDLDPPLYIDRISNKLGRIDLASSPRLLRELLRLEPVSPERVAEVNAYLDEICDGSAFPQLRAIAPTVQSLSSLTPQLVLAADEQAIVHFVYNGTPVDSRRTQDRPAGASAPTVRLMVGDTLCEVPRDAARESLFLGQFADSLPAPAQTRADWLAFAMDGVPKLRSAGWQVLIEEGFPYQLVTAQQWYGELGADQRRSAWFNLRLGVMVDGSPINLLGALTRYLQSTWAEAQGKGVDSQADPDESGCRIGDFWVIRLDDGRYLPLALDRIQRIAQTLVELFDRDCLTEGQTLALPRSQGGRLAQLAMELNGPALTCNDAGLASLIEGLKNFSGIRALAAPDNFRGELRPYQQEGLGWLQFLREFRLGGILADDMGLGKTVQTIAHIALEITRGRLTRPVLIVCPVSALGNWHNELTRFAPSLSIHTWHGAERRKSLHRLGLAQVILTAYPLLLIDSEVLLAREYGLVILDEAQTIKNPAAKVSQMARSLRADSRLCLSGTPVENHLGELWALLDFLQPGLLGDERDFQRHYRTPIERNGDRARAEALSARLAPFLLRRTKDAVAKELPAKVEMIESITLDETQRDFYDGVRLAMHQRIREIIREQGLARSQITILDALLKLRQVCCDPRLVRGEREATDLIPSAKLEWLETVVPELVAEGRRILLFSQFTSLLRLLEPVLARLAIPYCLLTGETRDRSSVVERFQSGQVPLFLISLKAGGTALNLTAADTVIHYDPWWNPAVEAQATDRAHRIGQTRSVFVYKLIAAGTVEERMLQLQADKKVLADHLYTDKSSAPTALNAHDIEMLLAP